MLPEHAATLNHTDTPLLGEHRVDLPSLEGVEIRRLLVAAQSGDERSFGLLIRHYEQHALSVAYRLLGNRADALDATQDALLRLYRFIDRVDGERDFGAWLYRVVVNASMDVMERRKRHAGAVKEMQATIVPQDFTVTPGAEQAIAQRRSGAAITLLLERLPPKERAALILRDVEGLSTREVARVLNSSETTVRSQICAARTKLRALRTEIEGNDRSGRAGER